MPVLCPVGYIIRSVTYMSTQSSETGNLELCAESGACRSPALALEFSCITSLYLGCARKDGIDPMISLVLKSALHTIRPI